MKRKLLTLLLAGALVTSMMPETGMVLKAEESTGTKDSFGSAVLTPQMIKDISEDSNLDYVTQAEKDEILKMESTLPEQYDLTDLGLIDGIDEKNVNPIVTPVKNQSPYGACWGFAGIAAAEGSIIAEMKEKGMDISPLSEEMDFSEKHLAWFSGTAMGDKNNSQYGEGRNLPTNPDVKISDSDIYDVGGEAYYTGNMFAAGIGPVLEKDYPYQGKNGKVQYGNNITGKRVPVCYSVDDEWALDEADRFKQVYRLEETNILPELQLIDEEGGQQFNPVALDLIKQQIVKGRPVAISIYADNSMPGMEAEETYLNFETWAQNTSDYFGYTHRVTIVGYDDSYSKENFLEGKQPEKDGAWLVKNSWGSELQTFPHIGEKAWGLEDQNGKHTGYFWVSYYDYSLQGAEVFDFDIEKREQGEIINQYDFLQTTGVGSTQTNTETHMANVFTAEKNQKLTAVSCQTAVPNTSVDYEIYLLNDDAKHPRDGVLLAQGSSVYEFGGYHRYELTAVQPMIQKGQKFSVVVTEKTPDGMYSVNVNADRRRGVEEGLWVRGVVNKGESFVCVNGVWSDWTEEVKKMKREEPDDEYDNLSIKAFGQPTEDIQFCIIDARTGERANQVEIDGTREEKTIPVKVIYTGKNIGDLDDTIEFENSDESVVKVKESGKVDAYQLVPLKVGTAQIVVKSEKLGMFVINVTVKDSSNLSLATVNTPKVTYTGENIRNVEFEIVNGDVKVYEGCYEVSYPTNCKNVGTYRVMISGVGGYFGSVEAKFTIIPKGTVVKSLTAGKGKVKVAWKKQATQTTGYQIRYSRKSSMANSKAVTIKNNKATEKTIRNLKSGKKYYVQIRTYKKTAEKTYYSKWSKRKTVKIK